MKIVIVGGVAGGATTATRLRRLSENNEIILFERGENISFANCGLPYYISDVISKKEDLLVQTPKAFKDRFNIDVRIKQEVISINKENKTVDVKNLSTGETYTETYDKLVLSPGAEPINPFKNLNSKRIFTLRTIDDSNRIKEYISKNDVKNVVIVGGGYIGVEMAENLSHLSSREKCNTNENMQIDLKEPKNINISIVEKSSHLIPTIDADMASFVHKALIKNSVKVFLNQGVESIIEGDELFIKLENMSIKADMVILCIGIRPESTLAKGAGLAVNERGYIIVDEKMLTSDENIYALGDADLIENAITGRKSPLALAGPANRQARIVANNIMGMESKYEGFIGSSILKIFDYTLGMTGLSEKPCREQNIEYKTMIISPYSHAKYYPGAKVMTIKVLYRAGKKNAYINNEAENTELKNCTGQILGATVFGKEGIDKVTDILATAIRNKMTAKDLSELELCYAPPYSSAKSPVNIIGNSIENEMDGLVDTISVTEFLRNFEQYSNKDKYIILDVRTETEYDLSHIEGAINIPLDELREHLKELEKKAQIKADNSDKEDSPNEDNNSNKADNSNVILESTNESSNEVANVTKEIIVHCHSGLRSYIACRILKENGFKVKNLIGGYVMYDIVKNYASI